MVLYWTRSHSFVSFLGCGTTVLLPNKRSGREVQPLAALYPTARLSPWRQVRKISTLGCGLPVTPDLYSTLEVHPSWFPLVPSDWGIWASPLETDQDSCPGLPPVPLNLVSPRRASLSVPLPLDLSASPPPLFCHHFFCVFFVVPGIESLCETTANWKSLLIVTLKYPANVDYVTVQKLVLIYCSLRKY